ncbi:DUF7409 domain-containing protein [Halorubrum sp. DTA98]|uniref:DUF7409 domain-containing protein n=1 Tax=Halorubrum sp. DTA98 TaxID=3402163 RepID=UPI003AAC8C0B
MGEDDVDDGGTCDTLDTDGSPSESSSRSERPEPSGPSESSSPSDLRWVGPATAAVFAETGLETADVRDKRVSYRRLVDAGVNPGVAAKIRREYSLSWSFEAGDGLDRRSTQVRGLGTDEAAWVAASAGDWESSTERSDVSDAETDADGEADWVSASGTAPGADSAAADGSGDPVAAEAAWRSRSKPTPLSTLPAVDGDEGAAELLADAGITSVRSLATADPEHVADVLDLDPSRVTAWYEDARAEHD